MKLACLKHIDLLFILVLCFCRCLWLFTRRFFFVLFEALNFLVWLRNLSIKIFVSFLFSEIPGSEYQYMRGVVRRCDYFLIVCYVLTTGSKAIQNTSFRWCSDLRVTANQIIFHTFREKPRGLHTRLATVDYRRPLSEFFFSFFGA